MIRNKPISVVELGPFRQNKQKCFEDKQNLFELLDYLAWHPEIGDIIPGTGGLRKIRWKTQQSGKQGGLRVVYYYQDDRRPLYVITVYSKTRKERLSSNEKQKLSKLAKQLKLNDGD